MRLPRLPLLLLGFGVVLGLMLWLTTTIFQLYGTIASSSVLLANILVVGLIALCLALTAIVVYYGILFGRPRQQISKKATVNLPDHKIGVAEKTLQAVRLQVDQIQSEVARQALMVRSQEIEQDLKVSRTSDCGIRHGLGGEDFAGECTPRSNGRGGLTHFRALRRWAKPIGSSSRVFSASF